MPPSPGPPPVTPTVVPYEALASLVDLPLPSSLVSPLAGSAGAGSRASRAPGASLGPQASPGSPLPRSEAQALSPIQRRARLATRLMDLLSQGPREDGDLSPEDLSLTASAIVGSSSSALGASRGPAPEGLGTPVAAFSGRDRRSPGGRARPLLSSAGFSSTLTLTRTDGIASTAGTSRDPPIEDIPPAPDRSLPRPVERRDERAGRVYSPEELLQLNQMATIFYRLRTMRRYLRALRRLARIGELAKRPYKRALRAWHEHARAQQLLLRAWVFDRARLLRHAFFSLAAAVRRNESEQGLARKTLQQLRSALRRQQYRGRVAWEHHAAFLQRKAFYTLFRVLASRYQRCLSHVRRRDADLVARVFVAWRARAALHARVAEMDVTYALAQGLAVWRYAFVTRRAERFHRGALEARAFTVMREKHRALAAAEFLVLVSRGFDPAGAAATMRGGSGERDESPAARRRRACEGVGIRFPRRNISGLAAAGAASAAGTPSHELRESHDPHDPSEILFTPRLYSFLALQRSFRAWRARAEQARARREDYAAARLLYTRFLLSRAYGAMHAKYAEIHRRRLSVAHFRITLQRSVRAYYFQLWKSNVQEKRARETRLRLYLSARAERVEGRVFEAWLARTDAQRVTNHALRVLAERVGSRLRAEALLAWRERAHSMAALRGAAREFTRGVVLTGRKKWALCAWRTRLSLRAEAYAVCIPLLRECFDDCDLAERPTGGWFLRGSAGSLARRAFGTWLEKTRRMITLRAAGSAVRDAHILRLERNALSSMRKTLRGLRIAHVVEGAMLRVYGPPVLERMGLQLAMSRLGRAFEESCAGRLQRRVFQGWARACSEARRVRDASRRATALRDSRLLQAAFSGLARAAEEEREVRDYAELLLPVRRLWLARRALRAWLLALVSKLSAKGSRFLTDRLVERRNERASIPELVIAAIDLRAEAEEEDGAEAAGAQAAGPDPEAGEEVHLDTMDSPLASAALPVPSVARPAEGRVPPFTVPGRTEPPAIHELDARISSVRDKLSRFCGPDALYHGGVRPRRERGRPGISCAGVCGDAERVEQVEDAERSPDGLPSQV